MLKKVICVLVGIVLSMAELIIFGVSPMEALSGIILPVGFTALAFFALTDYLEDKKITAPMIVAYVCGLVFVALLGAAFKTGFMPLFVIALGMACVSLVCYLYDNNKQQV